MHSLALRFVIVAALVSFAAAGAAQTARKPAPQTWPTKPIRLIVNAAAGGSTDVTARSMSNRLSEVLGQQVVVDNRVGAGGLARRPGGGGRAI